MAGVDTSGVCSNVSKFFLSFEFFDNFMELFSMGFSSSILFLLSFLINVCNVPVFQYGLKKCGSGGGCEQILAMSFKEMLTSTPWRTQEARGPAGRRAVSRSWPTNFNDV